MAYQTCRICGATIAAGYTNCDSCYHKNDKVKSEKILQLKNVLNTKLNQQAGRK